MDQQRYCIWIVSPPGYTHSRCFEEVALGLSEAFGALGCDAPIVTQPEHVTGTPIILGCNLLGPVAPPAGAILFNLEQISLDSAWLGNGYIELLRRHRVWDYSTRNIIALSELGIEATLCGIGYSPGLTRISPAPVQDIDVLFVGSMNERRHAVLQGLADRGVNVFTAFNLYGQERDALCARAKIVLNIHYYEAKVLEIVRVSYLLANRIPVVSESGQDLALEASLAEGIAFAPYDELMPACLRLLADGEGRARLGQRGFEIFSTRDQAAMLSAAVNSAA
jgi:hypothetical protein